MIVSYTFASIAISAKSGLHCCIHRFTSHAGADGQRASIHRLDSRCVCLLVGVLYIIQSALCMPLCMPTLSGREIGAVIIAYTGRFRVGSEWAIPLAHRAKSSYKVWSNNLHAQQPILVILGRDVAERVCYQMAICYPTSGET